MKRSSLLRHLRQHWELTHFVWLHDDFPGLGGVPSLDDEPPFNDVGMMTARVLQHATDVYLVERAILHAFQKGGRSTLTGPRSYVPLVGCSRLGGCSSA